MFLLAGFGMVFNRLFDSKSPERANRIERKAWLQKAKEADAQKGPVPNTSFLEQVEAMEEEMYGKTTRRTNKTREEIERRIEESLNQE